MQTNTTKNDPKIRNNKNNNTKPAPFITQLVSGRTHISQQPISQSSMISMFSPRNIMKYISTTIQQYQNPVPIKSYKKSQAQEAQFLSSFQTYWTKIQDEYKKYTRMKSSISYFHQTQQQKNNKDHKHINHNTNKHSTPTKHQKNQQLLNKLKLQRIPQYYFQQKFQFFYQQKINKIALKKKQQQITQYLDQIEILIYQKTSKNPSKYFLCINNFQETIQRVNNGLVKVKEFRMRFKEKLIRIWEKLSRIKKLNNKKQKIVKLIKYVEIVKKINSLERKNTQAQKQPQTIKPLSSTSSFTLNSTSHKLQILQNVKKKQLEICSKISSLHKIVNNLQFYRQDIKNQIYQQFNIKIHQLMIKILFYDKQIWYKNSQSKKGKYLKTNNEINKILQGKINHNYDVKEQRQKFNQNDNQDNYYEENNNLLEQSKLNITILDQSGFGDMILGNQNYNFGSSLNKPSSKKQIQSYSHAQPSTTFPFSSSSTFEQLNPSPISQNPHSHLSTLKSLIMNLHKIWSSITKFDLYDQQQVNQLIMRQLIKHNVMFNNDMNDYIKIVYKGEDEMKIVNDKRMKQRFLLDKQKQSKTGMDLILENDNQEEGKDDKNRSYQKDNSNRNQQKSINNNKNINKSPVSIDTPSKASKKSSNNSDQQQIYLQQQQQYQYQHYQNQINNKNPISPSSEQKYKQHNKNKFLISTISSLTNNSINQINKNIKDINKNIKKKTINTFKKFSNVKAIGKVWENLTTGNNGDCDQLEQTGNNSKIHIKSIKPLKQQTKYCKLKQSQIPQSQKIPSPRKTFPQSLPLNPQLKQTQLLSSVDIKFFLKAIKFYYQILSSFIIFIKQNTQLTFFHNFLHHLYIFIGQRIKYFFSLRNINESTNVENFLLYLQLIEYWIDVCDEVYDSLFNLKLTIIEEYLLCLQKNALVNELKKSIDQSTYTITSINSNYLNSFYYVFFWVEIQQLKHQQVNNMSLTILKQDFLPSLTPTSLTNSSPQSNLFFDPDIKTYFQSLKIIDKKIIFKQNQYFICQSLLILIKQLEKYLQLKEVLEGFKKNIEEKICQIVGFYIWYNQKNITGNMNGGKGNNIGKSNLVNNGNGKSLKSLKNLCILFSTISLLKIIFVQQLSLQNNKKYQKTLQQFNQFFKFIQTNLQMTPFLLIQQQISLIYENNSIPTKSSTNYQIPSKQTLQILYLLKQTLQQLKIYFYRQKIIKILQPTIKIIYKNYYGYLSSLGKKGLLEIKEFLPKYKELLLNYGFKEERDKESGKQKQMKSKQMNSQQQDTHIFMKQLGQIEKSFKSKASQIK